VARPVDDSATSARQFLDKSRAGRRRGGQGGVMVMVAIYFMSAARKKCRIPRKPSRSLSAGD
jgi:hypothetical protein